MSRLLTHACIISSPTMGWFDWFCCRKTESIQEEEEVVICPPTASPESTNDSTSVAGSSEMGKAVSKVKSFFSSEKPTSPHERPPRRNVPPSDISVHSSLVGESYEPLASPRSPLRRGIETLTPPDTPILPPSKRLKGENVLYMDFPMLMDETTIDYVQRNKVMVIMKGLSGSGKSSILKNMQMLYEDTVICSADHFFMVDGEYNFDHQKLKDAHAACQNKAQEAAKRNCHVITIDNTNIRNWESQEYIRMCKDHHYVAIILEPQTPWRLNATELAVRSTHGLEEEFLAKKVKMYQKPSPIYYAWFLNTSDSQMISKIAWQWLERSLFEIEEFCQDFSQFSNLDSVQDMLEYFANENVILHMTSKYTARGKKDGALEYMNNPEVIGSLGKCYPIHIIGYVITPRTFGARVKLTEDELELWGNNDYETRPDDFMLEGAVHNKNERLNGSEDNADTESHNDDHVDIVDLCEARITYKSQGLDKNRFYPTSGKGSRGHLTLGCAYGVKAVTTGFDLIDVVSCEQRTKDESTDAEDKNLMDVDSHFQKNVTYNISGAVLKSYGEGRWVIYPDAAAHSFSLFSGYY